MAKDRVIQIGIEQSRYIALTERGKLYIGKKIVIQHGRNMEWEEINLPPDCEVDSDE